MTDITDLDTIFTTWAQEKLGQRYHKLVSVDTTDLSIIKGKETYHEEDRKEDDRVSTIKKILVNDLDVPSEDELSVENTTKYSCQWSQTKGFRLSSDVSVQVGLPAITGLTAKAGVQFNLSKTKAEARETDESYAHKRKLTLPPHSKVLASMVTRERVYRMTFTLDIFLQGTVSIKMMKDSGKTKTAPGDVVDIFQQCGKKGTFRIDKCPDGKKGVCLTIEGTFEGVRGIDQRVETRELDHETEMKMVHEDLLKNNISTFVEEVKDHQSLSKLLEAMSLKQVLFAGEVQTSNEVSVKETIEEVVGVLASKDPTKYLLFVEVLEEEGLDDLAKALDPRVKYSASIRGISNLGGVVDHFFTTKKIKEVYKSLETSRGAVIYGISGSGKTQLAYKVASDYARFNPGAVVWVMDGSSRDKLNEEVQTLQQRLSGGSEDGNNHISSLVNQRSHVVLVVDDLSATVAIPNDILNSSAKLIVTTQNSAFNLPTANSIVMEGFTEGEAVEFLSNGLSSDIPRDGIEELARSFSCLPLGLAAARATIQQCSMTFPEYIQLLNSGKEAMAQTREREDQWLQAHYHKAEHQDAGRTIFAALEVAIDKLDDQYKSMLQLCAFLKPRDIPFLILRDALKAASPASRLAYHLEFAGQLKERSLGWIKGVGVNRRLSIHGVTQTAIGLRMDEQQKISCINMLLEILVKFFSKDNRYFVAHNFSMSLMPHVERVLEHADGMAMGPEYPLMKSMLLGVYGFLHTQKETRVLSEKPLQDAKKLLLQFASVNPQALQEKVLEDKQEDNRDRDLEESPRAEARELYKVLSAKSCSLKDHFLQDTVIGMIVTEQQFRAIQDKLTPKDRTDMESVVKTYDSLTPQMYQKLADNKLAMPVETLREVFLPELYISTIYTLGRTIFYLSDQYPPGSDRRAPFIRDMQVAYYLCEEVTNATGCSLLHTFLSKAEGLNKLLLEVEGKAKEQVMPDLQRAEGFYKTMLGDRTEYYEFGLLKRVGPDVHTKLRCHEKLVKCYRAMFMNAEEKKNGFIKKGQEECDRMLKLAEDEIRAGNLNPPQRLSAYYITAGQFMMDDGKPELLEKAGEMFKKGYRVELKKKTYHPCMEAALKGLIQVYTAKKQLPRALVCARHLLKLSDDHWPDKKSAVQEKLAHIYFQICFQAWKVYKKEDL
ncbi:PREDICTED: uncharacterized protein LOC109474980 isoform X1 [Branchiostoma belcheri]|uniref:Uncharacterized protein LOC109474980 isoform X1 n=1 Tax=Branchiostoma belcheri TaxID=7741 RepID=A0A6P4ZAW3_BRABE|nr:PREDICTED: uncharacterized protein LOC109474980 isoform X1 [Branchiostoma belcheri]XP_019631040.1 PREDICTED: uncharacterized protein LOC109474980 isoform X1 [Branchiostoma belcheri]